MLNSNLVWTTLPRDTAKPISECDPSPQTINLLMAPTSTIIQINQTVSIPTGEVPLPMDWFLRNALLVIICYSESFSTTRFRVGQRKTVVIGRSSEQTPLLQYKRFASKYVFHRFRWQGTDSLWSLQWPLTRGEYVTEAPVFGGLQVDIMVCIKWYTPRHRCFVMLFKFSPHEGCSV